jgi:hypothetical protein
MPVTAKLSRKFYDTFGDELTNELVEWFNQVDATYRAELRELNELNFARFDAKLEQRMAELRAEFAELRAELRTAMGSGLADLRTELGSGLADLRTESGSGLAGLEGRMLARIGVLEGGLIGRIGMVEGRLTRLTVLLRATLAATLVGFLKLH